MASCPEGNFSSITNVLSEADAGNLNVTLLVQNCSQICTLAWGNGNPDLSGIGANVSYILQFVLIVIFGPVFTLIYGLREKLKLREKTDAPFFEVTFLQSLMSMQFFGLLANILATGVVRPTRSPARIALLVVYAVVNFGFYMGLVGHLRTSKASYATIKELAHACQGYGAILPGFQDPNTSIPHIDKNAFKPFNFKNKGGWIISGLITAGVAALIVLVLFLIFFGWVLYDHNVFALGLMSLGLTAGALYEVVEMELKRNVIKALSGSSFQDNEWGFGQVISLFMWVPLLIQAMYYLARRAFDSRDTATADSPATKEAGLHACPCTCACAAPHSSRSAPAPRRRSPRTPAPGAATEEVAEASNAAPEPHVETANAAGASDETPSLSADPEKDDPEKDMEASAVVDTLPSV